MCNVNCSKLNFGKKTVLRNKIYSKIVYIAKQEGVAYSRGLQHPPPPVNFGFILNVIIYNLNYLDILDIA